LRRSCKLICLLFRPFIGGKGKNTTTKSTSFLFLIFFLMHSLGKSLLELVDESVSITVAGNFGVVEIWGVPPENPEKLFPLMVTNGKVSILLSLSLFFFFFSFSYFVYSLFFSELIYIVVVCFLGIGKTEV
jgi:hypothetical protein